MTKKTVTFTIATQYKNRPVNVSFYTREGKTVRFTGTTKVPAKELVRLRAKAS